MSDASLSAYSGASSSTAELSDEPSAVAGAGRISRGDVAHLARLARLAVTDEELDVFAGQLDVILGAVARVGEVTTGGSAEIPPMSHAVSMTNVFRADEVTPSLPRDAVLGAAPAVEDGKFRVPRILAEGV